VNWCFCTSMQVVFYLSFSFALYVEHLLCNIVTEALGRLLKLI
jgi:hypothetical protein